jgi:membrane-bound serine protease (ClpP class)
VPPQAVVEDQSLVGDWRPVMLRRGRPNHGPQGATIETLIATELRDRRVNWIGLSIDSAGGELARLPPVGRYACALDANEVQTVAYVPVEASGGAALVALACNQFDHAARSAPRRQRHRRSGPADDRRRYGISIRDSLAKNTDHSWSLLAAMIDPG